MCPYQLQNFFFDVHISFLYPNCLRKQSANNSLKLVDLDCTSTRMRWQIMMGWPHPPAGTCGTLESSKRGKTQLAEGLRSSSSQIPHPEARCSPLFSSWASPQPALKSFQQGEPHFVLMGIPCSCSQTDCTERKPCGANSASSLYPYTGASTHLGWDGKTLTSVVHIPQRAGPGLPWGQWCWPYPLIASDCVRPALSQCLVGVCAASPHSKQPSAPLFPGFSSPAGLSHSAPPPPPHSFPWGALSFTCSWQDMKSASFRQLAGYGAWSSLQIHPVTPDEFSEVLWSPVSSSDMRVIGLFLWLFGNDEIQPHTSRA